MLGKRPDPDRVVTESAGEHHRRALEIALHVRAERREPRELEQHHRLLSIVLGLPELDLDLLRLFARAPRRVRLGELDARELRQSRERRKVSLADLAPGHERRERACDLVAPYDRRGEQCLGVAAVSEVKRAVLDLLGRSGLHDAQERFARGAVPPGLRDVVRRIGGKAGLPGQDDCDPVELAERREVGKARGPEVSAGPAAQPSPSALRRWTLRPRSGTPVRCGCRTRVAAAARRSHAAHWRTPPSS